MWPLVIIGLAIIVGVLVIVAYGKRQASPQEGEVVVYEEGDWWGPWWGHWPRSGGSSGSWPWRPHRPHHGHGPHPGPRPGHHMLGPGGTRPMMGPGGTRPGGPGGRH